MQNIYMKFKVCIGYRSFMFYDIDEAVIFIQQAFIHRTEDDDFRIVIEEDNPEDPEDDKGGEP